ncbi:hypothetical protein ElyMa_005398600, partial [Elysia marginata]
RISRSSRRGAADSQVIECKLVRRFCLAGLDEFAVWKAFETGPPRSLNAAVDEVSRFQGTGSVSQGRNSEFEEGRIAWMGGGGSSPDREDRSRKKRDQHWALCSQDYGDCDRTRTRYVSPVREFRPHHLSGYGRSSAFNGERGEVWGDFREGKDRHRRAYHKENGGTCKLVRAVSRSPEKVEPAMVGMMKKIRNSNGRDHPEDRVNGGKEIRVMRFLMELLLHYRGEGVWGIEASEALKSANSRNLSFTEFSVRMGGQAVVGCLGSGMGLQARWGGMGSLGFLESDGDRAAGGCSP